MQPILSPPWPFHTITLDFILGLPTSIEGFDCVMSVTDKFSKAVTFVPGKTNWGGREWAVQLLARLDLLGWGLPNAIISDRDVQFVAGLWRAIFEHLHVKLFYSTAYHPQTDSASEATNQQAEIALWYYLMTMDNLAEWPTVLPRLQAASNNTYRSSTCQTPNEVLYGFRPSEALDLLQRSFPIKHNHGPVIAAKTPQPEQGSTTIKAYPTQEESIKEERAAERARLQEVWKRNLLRTMSSY